MAKTPGSSSRPDKVAAPAKPGALSVPSANVEYLRQTLGVDVTKDSEEFRAIVQRRTMSISSSPYTSPEMLEEYVKRGFPDMPAMVIQAIDRQVAHRQSLERLETERSERRQDRAQTGAQVIGILGLLASLFAAWFGVSPWVCGIGIIVSIGGPNAATVVGRVMDRYNKATS